jgi:hypothetical protein
MFKAAFCAVEELVYEDNVAGPVFLLERTNGADADDPGDAKFLHGPDVGAMVQLARQNAMAAGVTWKKNNFATGESSREQFIGWWTKGRHELRPVLVCEALDIVEPAAADDADTMF